MTHNNYKYHLEMMISEATNWQEKFKNKDYKDTRVYLSLDREELVIGRILKLLNQECC